MLRDHGGPCTHAVIAARVRKLDLYALFGNVFNISTYNNIYQASMRPVIVRELELGPGYLPPLISKREV